MASGHPAADEFATADGRHHEKREDSMRHDIAPSSPEQATMTTPWLPFSTTPQPPGSVSAVSSTSHPYQPAQMPFAPSQMTSDQFQLQFPIPDELLRIPDGSSVSEADAVLAENGRTYHGYKEGKYFLPNDPVCNIALPMNDLTSND